MAFLDDAGLVKLWQHIQARLSNKVDKVEFYETIQKLQEDIPKINYFTTDYIDEVTGGCPLPPPTSMLHFKN